MLSGQGELAKNGSEGASRQKVFFRHLLFKHRPIQHME